MGRTIKFNAPTGVDVMPNFTVGDTDYTTTSGSNIVYDGPVDTEATELLGFRDVVYASNTPYVTRNVGLLVRFYILYSGSKVFALETGNTGIGYALLRVGPDIPDGTYPSFTDTQINGWPQLGTYSRFYDAGGGRTYYVYANTDSEGHVNYSYGIWYQPSSNIYLYNGIGSAVSPTSNAYTTFTASVSPAKFPGDPSTTGGGIGNFDLSSDPIDFPALPTTGAVNSKFVTLYNPTEGELNQIQSYLWTTDMGQAWEAIFKFIQDPMDMVIGLNMFPFTIPSAGLSPTKEPVEAGIIDIMADPLTKVTSYKLLSQYIELDCGTLDVGQFYGTALDFQPYTKATIHVPFCGDYPLNIDDIRSNLDMSVNGKTLQLKYHVDMFSGACVAMLKVGDAVLYQWSGSMAMNVPLTGSDYSNTIQNVISTATTIGLGAATGGVGAAGGAAAAEGATAGVSSAAAASDARLANLAGATTNMAGSLKPQIQRAGSVAGSAGFLGVQDPYIVFEMPRQSIAEDYAKFMGFPCNISYTLSSLVGKGFTVVSNMHLENIVTNTAAKSCGATDGELGEIEQLLSGGVIL